MNGRTCMVLDDACTDYPKPICPINFFEVRGKILFLVLSDCMPCRTISALAIDYFLSSFLEHSMLVLLCSGIILLITGEFGVWHFHFDIYCIRPHELCFDCDLSAKVPIIGGNITFKVNLFRLYQYS